MLTCYLGFTLYASPSLWCSGCYFCFNASPNQVMNNSAKNAAEELSSPFLPLVVSIAGSSWSSFSLSVVSSSASTAVSSLLYRLPFRRSPVRFRRLVVAVIASSCIGQFSVPDIVIYAAIPPTATMPTTRFLPISSSLLDSRILQRARLTDIEKCVHSK